MPKICKVTINGETVPARPGDLLLDAALMNGIELPHDCRSGYCGTCQVRVVNGRCFGGATENTNVVHACQTRVISDLHIVAERTPHVTENSATVADVIDLAPDVLEVCIEAPPGPTPLPGQYLSVRFRGYPPRYYSPTRPLDWPSDPNLIRFHVRRLAKGRVSSALGRKIKRGHRVKLTGPFGAAYFRPQQCERFVLVSSGTGFAPIWAIAEAAIKENPRRHLVLIVGARDLDSLYMIPALCRLARFPHVIIIPTVLRRQGVTPAVRFGQPTEYLPALSPNDLIYVAGGPAVVNATAQIAQSGGASYFADPFLPAVAKSNGETFLARSARWIASGLQSSRH
ncbi:MAG TPA: 2Fe-2S iron-sulfur cluster-binding protein [Xanthobacteraceae bacterium]|nr:2Fe-2S iron-sulfur cluster-binding protein [Xanthobacteraceae bacterium]